MTMSEIIPHPRSTPTQPHGSSPAERRPLRIAQLAGVVEAVPPAKYGGTERVVSLLTEELVHRGHDVTLFASGDSRTAARLVPTVDAALWHNPRFQAAEPFLAGAVDAVFSRGEAFDVVHNHVGFFAYPTARAHPELPFLSTPHGRLDLPELEPLYRRFAALPLVSISDSQRQPLPWANWQGTVYHGVDLQALAFQPSDDGYLAFLGRISAEKGLDTAVAVARRTGMPLKVAARMPLDPSFGSDAGDDWRYYREVVEPLLRTPGVEYVGEVSGEEKAAFLGGAAALLFPITWPEPFGLVMAEALACGTPVVAFRRGSVPELIADGETGYVVETEEEMAAAVARIGAISRSSCRATAEQRFSVAAMVDGYEAIYERLIAAQQQTVAGRAAG